MRIVKSALVAARRSGSRLKPLPHQELPRGKRDVSRSRVRQSWITLA